MPAQLIPGPPTAGRPRAPNPCAPVDTRLTLAIRASLLLALTWVTLTTAGRAHAQSDSSGETRDARPTAQAAPRQGEVHIDGRPNEYAWQRAVSVTEFVQGEPVENAPAEQATEVKVLYDESALYVSAIMHDWQPTRIADQLVRRDENGQYDYFELSLDPNNDRRTGYRFRVSAAGVQRDVYLFDDVREDEAWDAIWESAVNRDSLGWTAELRIPLSQLQYNAADTLQSWGVNFSRRRLVSNERTYFALESRVRHGKVSVFARLEGLHFPNSARHIEVRPYVLTSAHAAPAEAGDPFFDGSELDGRLGLDMRLGLGASPTLDLTFNPDFGQVEVDPAVINLTAFETFFPEKRPFFVENAQIFDFNLSGRRNQLFYSRRIGREPQGQLPDETDYSDVPGETTILTAAKLTGRSARGLSLGGLLALTGSETGKSFDSELGIIEEFTVEPASQYGVLRAVQDLRQGATQLGAILTATHRNLPDDSNFDFLVSNAYSLGIDFEHNWGGPGSRDWALWGYFAGTHIRGSDAALLEVQQSSNHYFQRPDATRFSLDSAATSLTGVNWRVQFERRSARHWTGALWLGEISPGFEANDLGFLTDGERLDGGFRIGYQEITPGSLFRSYQLRLFTVHNWRHEALDDVLSWSSWDRAHKSGNYSLDGEFEFLNYWQVELETRYRPETLSDTDTRGGPLMIDPASTTYEIGLRTDRRAPVFLEPRFEYTSQHRGGYRWQSEMEIAVRPAPSVELQLRPQYGQEREPAQYVTQTDDVGFQPTYGKRYLFSDLKRQQISLDTRMSVAFNPKLTLQFFAQPLISAGNYLTYKQLDRSESFEFDVFEEGSAALDGDEVTCVGGRTCTVDDERYVDFEGDGSVDFSFSDRNFNIRSLRLNAVLRWEYRPGSTLFLVWQQNRRDRADIGDFDLGRDLDALGSIGAENVFIVKVNYWLGL
ncbi:MAG: carbohydrate binding family 9 domain-containing protein [Gemmatimonadota bacterium]|nr:MAG: carbohydrate binding family 9 domain-containing protein [Gemmatimonadota bacterium]